MRLLFHPESDCLYLGPLEDLDEGLIEDVSDVEEFRKLAVLEDLDLDEIKPIPEALVEMADENPGQAGAIIKSMAKWNRKPADLYPTPPDCVYSLLPHIEDIMPEGSLVLEPACANGQISKALRLCGYQTDDYDLRPEVEFGTGGVDFLDPDNFDPDSYGFILTNPPFAAAEEFVRRGLVVAPVVILLLKSQYFHVAKRLGLWREMTPEWEFKLTWRPAFLEKERGKSPLMDCSWFVFNRTWGEDYTKSRPIERVKFAPLDYGGL